MSTDAAVSPLGYRLCRRIGICVLGGVIAMEAALLGFSFAASQKKLLSALENEKKSVTSVLYNRNTDPSAETLLKLGDSLVRQGTLAGGILYDARNREIGRFGAVPGQTDTTSGKSWHDVRWPEVELGVPYSLAARLDTTIPTSDHGRTFLLIAIASLLGTLCLAGVVMVIFGRRVAAPLARVADTLIAASQDLGNIQQYAMADANPDNEVGDIITASNRLFEEIALSHRDSLYTVKTMADRASVAILTYDNRGKIHYANQACLRMCDFHSLEEMQASELPRFRFASEAIPQSLPESTITGPYSREAVLIGRDDKTCAVVVNAARIPEESKSAVRYYASITDISDRRAAEELLRQQNIELETANRAKSQFLANMSHELRTPLNAIIGFSEMIRNATFGPLGNDHYQEYASDIHDSGKHLLGIINDILDLSKIEAGQMELHDSHLDVREIVNAAVRIVHERAAKAELKLVVQLSENLPTLHADERAVKQMLINLLSNAIKFTEAGGTITVGADCRNDRLLLGVADTGIGMTKEDAIVAMKPFGMIDDSNTRQQEGTGLGLPLVKSLIELHGGRIRLDSGLRRGTTVTLTFPPERTVRAVANVDSGRSVA